MRNKLEETETKGIVGGKRKPEQRKNGLRKGEPGPNHDLGGKKKDRQRSKGEAIRKGER